MTKVVLLRLGYTSETRIRGLQGLLVKIGNPRIVVLGFRELKVFKTRTLRSSIELQGFDTRIGLRD